MLFTVTLSSSSTQAATVAYATTDGTALHNDNDYVPTSGTLTFAVGATSAVITVMVNGDTKNEADENFTIDAHRIHGRDARRARHRPAASFKTTTRCPP